MSIEQKTRELRKYAHVLSLSISKEYWNYAFGVRKRPKKKKIIGELMREFIEKTETRYGISRRMGFGRWKLDMEERDKFDNWCIFPLRSDHVIYLDILVKELPRFFPEKEFYIKDSMTIPGF